MDVTLTLLLITCIEWLYLIYMFFIFKTHYYIGPSILESYMTKMGSFFIHHTGRYESKICDLGRALVIVAILLSVIRLYVGVTECHSWTIFFIIFSLVVASLLNLNAFIYIIPLVCIELYIVFFIKNNMFLYQKV